jgi:hypothetical protein
MSDAALHGFANVCLAAFFGGLTAVVLSLAFVAVFGLWRR